MFSEQARCIYRNNPLGEVICQLRFPQILRISSQPPVDFQEAIRSVFPQYQALTEHPMPKIMGTPGNLSLDQQQTTVNHQFLSADGVWRVNLTDKFISLACSRYTRWESFARMLDQPLAAFIQIYKPAYFERIGLRYLNFFSRKALDLEHIPFRELIAPMYLGMLSDAQVPLGNTIRCSVDGDTALRGGCRVKIHAGPGMVKKGQMADQELKFIFDQDLYMPGKIPVNHSAGALQTLHLQAYPIFRYAITDKLHEALGPEAL